MSQQITWSQIEAECGDYRAGFVAVFKRYEGQPTDEKDSRGHIVKVTMSSFARHAGIEETTFRRWVKKAKTGTSPVQASAGTHRATRSAVRRLPPQQKAALTRELQEDPEVQEENQKHYTEELQRRRARRTAQQDELDAGHGELIRALDGQHPAEGHMVEALRWARMAAADREKFEPNENQAARLEQQTVEMAALMSVLRGESLVNDDELRELLDG